MKHLKVIITFLLFPLNLFAQQDGPRNGEYPDYTINPSWEFYSDNKLSTISASKGYTGVASLGDISSISLNPSSLNVDKRFNMNASISYKSSFNYQPIISDDIHLKSVIPSLFVGSGYRINENFQTGLAYQNNYSYKLVYDMIYTNEFGNEIGRGETYYKFASHSFLVPLVFNYEWLRLGTNLNLTYLRGDFSSGEGINHPNYPLTGKGELWCFIPQVGFIITPNTYVSLGASYTFGFSGNSIWDYNKFFITPQSLYCDVPSRLIAGVESKLLENKLKLSLEYHYANTSGIYNLKDKHNIHLGTEYSIDDFWVVRGGFFTLFDFRDNRNIWYDNNSYDQYFITLGGTYKYKGLAFNLALLSSSLTSSSDVKHSIVNAGIGYDF